MRGSAWSFRGRGCTCNCHCANAAVTTTKAFPCLQRPERLGSGRADEADACCSDSRGHKLWRSAIYSVELKLQYRAEHAAWVMIVRTND
jgi:hypothetical protein